MQKETFVVYCKNQINSHNPNLSENGIVGMFKLRDNVHGEKRVLKFKLKVLNLLEAESCSDYIEILNDLDVIENIKGEDNFITFQVNIGGICEEYQVQKLFKF